MSRLAILTGSSRGMGLAMAQQLLADGWQVLGIARKPNPALSCEQWAMDLAQPAAAADRLAAWLEGLDATQLEEVALINNAAVVGTIAPLRDVAADDIASALRINLEAPMLLASAFLRATGNWRARRKVLNISSGLGRRAMAASAAYCAAKAGMDHFTRCIALEEAGRPNGARAVSLAPGVIDTDMQVQLRGADPSGFPDHGNFVGLKANHALTSPAQAASRVLAYLARPDFGASPIADVRDA